MNIIKKTYSLFKSIKLVKGYSRNLLSDLQRERIFFVPDSLYEILSMDYFCFEDLKISYCSTDEERSVLDEYFDFLITNELIFEVPEKLKGYFPALSNEYKNPFIIANSVIDIDKNEFNYDEIFKQLKKIGCVNIELRFYQNIDLNGLTNILKIAESQGVKNIFLVLPYIAIDIELLCRTFLFLQRILFYNSPKDNNYLLEDFVVQIIHSKKHLHPKLDCGTCGASSFNLHHKHFLESQHHNTCLNGKISIDSNGEIKNCPSMSKSYGNIKDTTLFQALNKEGFKDVWNINKDQITVCKDCEFRHICTDCRAFLENPNDPLSKPLKCGYSPYTNEWEEWSTNPLKQKVKEFYSKILNESTKS